jgi:hypothetical protein
MDGIPVSPVTILMALAVRLRSAKLDGWSLDPEAVNSLAGICQRSAFQHCKNADNGLEEARRMQKEANQ